MELKKWCQSCQQYKRPEVGKFIVRGRIKRFSVIVVFNAYLNLI
jgi:hypothetical protein